MKLIINSNGIKREIHGSFSICGSRQDLETLVYFLQRGLREGFSYGWVDVHTQSINYVPNESPYDWWQGVKE